ncbi:hypothetical protein PHMEG_0004227 [Phytophthora megakarya]|uniref:Uncharacterized protein n=1 Tax=Phytophthora megakarya TaxID=4795 RepID=A0A225WVX2_9STRA|nr:hypothetical protein PHMEG_0004227 [Phytophthora megakarya]
MDSVTDADIMTALKACCQSLKNGFVPVVMTLFRQRLKMNFSIDDCDAGSFATMKTSTDLWKTMGYKD